MSPATATIITATIAAVAAIAGSVLTYVGRRENRSDHGSVFTHIVGLHEKVDRIDEHVDRVESKIDHHVDWEETQKYREGFGRRTVSDRRVSDMGPPTSGERRSSTADRRHATLKDLQ